MYTHIRETQDVHRAGSADYVVGLDMGTQSVRGLAVASNGTVVARASVAAIRNAMGWP
jgi:hypothetical protein